MSSEFSTERSALRSSARIRVTNMPPDGQIVFQKEKKANGAYNLSGQYSAPKDILDSVIDVNDESDVLKDHQVRRSKFERESDYQKQRYQRELSPERDPTISDEQLAQIREKEVQLGKEKKQEELDSLRKSNETPLKSGEDDGSKTPPRRTRKRRWDVGAEDNTTTTTTTTVAQTDETHHKKSRWDKEPDSSIVPTSDGAMGYVPPENNSSLTEITKEALITEVPGVKDLQFFKEQDAKYFGKLLDNKSENELSIEDVKERKIMKLLLKIKNGSPQVRKQAMRQITEGARQFGAKALFNQILPLLLEKSLDDQERHLMVKVIDRVMYRLDDMIRPFTHKILVVVSPLLIDEDYITRTEGREIISNLSKAAGLAHMISTIRPDIDHSDEYVRNTTARALAVVASALGIPALVPFLKAVCNSKKSWQARHTGIKAVQQIAILVGCGVLPHLNGLVECVGKGLTDEQLSVRIMAANALNALAEAAAPYGNESFEQIMEPLWRGILRHRGRGLASFLRCIGNIIPLMEPEEAASYTHEIMKVVLREFSSPDDEMKKTVLHVVQRCAATEGIQPAYLKKTVLPPLFKNFWTRRLALDRRSAKLVVETTVILSEKCGVSEIIDRLLITLKDESEPFRRMAVETVEKVVSKWGSSGLSERTDEMLIDGMLFAYQEQPITSTDPLVLKAFSTVLNSMGARTSPFIERIISEILHRIKNKTPEVRQQAADLIGLIAPVIKACDREDLLKMLSTVLYESLGEVFPEVLGSILGALKSIATVVGISALQPPVNQLLPHLTPILRNRHEKVQENAIDLVGRIADRGAEYVSPKEWMRICFELLDMLKSTRRGIRRAANNTFGYIAKAVGPQDVLVTLLNNLRVQERQLRVCTAVAIGIVAETCSPFTVLPALMNEYRTPETNVQNGVLKAMSFMFEYIGDTSADYVYAVAPLLEDALTDRDQVHRQTAASVIRQISLGCVGAGREDVFIHFLNLLIPNLYETSPHVIARILDSIEGVRTAVGPGLVMNYIWNGLFHPARKVRKPFWRVYNAAYVQQMDALVPYYPRVEEDKYKMNLFDVVL
ncbi:Splicing factor 3B subunit 1 [Cyberlindnera fabianii]|uniref:Splicing factor 3B subunit 1 n=1 Tax=Cyberlindnera fabianii TaxID=36022 RepID=A0A1V2L4M3_CYBFA|nr:Splicing factor 3B subunit 1 [Cyberlindnera fabianii]